jgi:thermostable 8-oxoguanine DNA glycosylase
MIDPTKITDFSRSRHDLEEFWLFCIIVAGKTASQMAIKLEQFLSGRHPTEGPFDYIRRLIDEDKLDAEMRSVKLGKYNLLNKGFPQSVAPHAPSLEHSSAQELSAIHGVNHKTARFFILHSRENADVAVIDTHVLKFLRHRGHEGIPTSVPQNDKYYVIEELMKSEARKSSLSYADFDLAVWNHYSSNGKTPLPLMAA